jgi:hypothetical protein
MPALRLLTKALPAFVLAVLILPGAAYGQATRTWVSGVGDDANPCSRTAPCKTFAGSISKTAAGGEINCLDPGGFGGVTITKSLTIKCHYTEGGVLVSGTNAIVINAAATDRVTLKGLDINGIGTGAQTSLTGVKVLSAGIVHLIDNEIYRFKAGIVVAPTSNSTRVLAKNNHIHNNGVGAILAPGNSLVNFAVMTMQGNLIADNTCGVASGAGGTNASTPDAALNCGTAAIGAINRPVGMHLYNNQIHDNTVDGVLGRGASSATELGRNEITGNSGFGLRRLDGANMRTFITPASNIISNNGGSDAPNQTTTQTR